MKPAGLVTRYAMAALTLALLAGVARADVIYLSSGGIVKGTIVKEGSDSITVKTAGGSTSIIPRAEIERIEKGASPEAIYRERLKKIALGDAEGHYQLGLWLKKINVKDLAREEFQKTIMLDPEHRFAREELGYSRDRFGRWVLPTEKPEEEAAVMASPAAPSAPEPKAEAEVKAPELKLDQNGLTPELAATLAALNGKDASARKAAFEKLEATIEGEADRLSTVLMGPFSKNRERIGQSIAKVSQGADAVCGKVPTEGSQDEALKAELRAHLDAYVEKAVRPTVLGTVRHAERVAANDLKKMSGFMKTFIKDYRTDSALKRREQAHAAWVKARDEALKVIFDLKIYPDENHGRVGQPIVDEKVDAVRAAWSFLDPQVLRDLSRYLAMTEADAKKNVQLLAEARAKHALAASYMESKGEKAEATADVPAIDEALLRYRAGQIDEALAMEPKLTAYEKELLKRMRDERTMEYNAGFATRKIEQGKVPDGLEIEQVKITNEYRIMQGRHAVEIDARLVASARGHSAEMTRLGYFAHESPVAENKSPWDRMKKEGYPGAGGENISLGSEAPKATHLAWYNSSGHHRNILGERWVAMGSGRDGRHWTQNFGGAAGLLKR